MQTRHVQGMSCHLLHGSTKLLQQDAPSLLLHCNMLPHLNLEARQTDAMPFELNDWPETDRLPWTYLIHATRLPDLMLVELVACLARHQVPSTQLHGFTAAVHHSHVCGAPPEAPPDCSKSARWCKPTSALQKLS